MVWVGPLIARHGPSGFQQLWALLQPVCQHYLFNSNSTEAEQEAAAKKVTELAQYIERQVKAKKVCVDAVMVR